MKQDDFRFFDYGKEKNIVYYGQKEPPSYYVDNFKERLEHVKIKLYVGTNDALVVKDDLNILKS